jgi:hypothetical protein
MGTNMENNTRVLCAGQIRRDHRLDYPAFPYQLEPKPGTATARARATVRVRAEDKCLGCKYAIELSNDEYTDLLRHQQKMFCLGNLIAKIFNTGEYLYNDDYWTKSENKIISDAGIGHYLCHIPSYPKELQDKLPRAKAMFDFAEKEKTEYENRLYKLAEEIGITKEDINKIRAPKNKFLAFFRGLQTKCTFVR